MSQLAIENKAYWEQQLELFKTSGLSRLKYCRNNGVNYDTFGYWIKKLNPEPPEFVPVTMKSVEPSTHEAILCTLELRGNTLKIHDLSALSFVLERLSP